MENQIPDRKTQIIAAIGVTFGVFALGSVLGWPSPALKMLKEQLEVQSVTKLSLITSISLVGTAVAQFFVCFVVEQFGSKTTMLFTTIPFMVGWVLILLSINIPLICIGRFITGFAGGVFCVAAPMYIGEIADKGIRGRLAVLFQLMLCMGILFAYLLGESHSYGGLTIPCLFLPATYFLIIQFLPESPVYLLAKGKSEKAKASLQFYRGKNYDCEEEWKSLEDYSQQTEEKFFSIFLKKASLKAFGSLIVLHIIQQFSGIKTVVFYAHPIFEMVGSNIKSGVSAIIVATMLVIFTGLSMLAVDKAGRKLLMIISLIIQVMSLCVIGLFFSIKKMDEQKAESLAWLPLIFCCIYIAGYSIGSGPLPWVVLSELLPKSIKKYCASMIAFTNYMAAFIVTETFPHFVEWFGVDVVFYLYSGICIAGTFFILFFLIETKGKTLEEIQIELGGSPIE